MVSGVFIFTGIAILLLIVFACFYFTTVSIWHRQRASNQLDRSIHHPMYTNPVPSTSGSALPCTQPSIDLEHAQGVDENGNPVVIVILPDASMHLGVVSREVVRGDTAGSEDELHVKWTDSPQVARLYTLDGGRSGSRHGLRDMDVDSEDGVRGLSMPIGSPEHPSQAQLHQPSTRDSSRGSSGIDASIAIGMAGSTVSETAEGPN
jgi:hypothetical protein